MELVMTMVAKESLKKNMKVFSEKLKRFPGLFWQTVWRVGRDDPRRVVHALKVGLSLTLVSLLYLLEPLFKGIGQNAIWAVMTVVVVLEFTAGATLCKGLNRGLGTLVAGSLAFFIGYIAEKTGHVFRAVFIGTAVFVIGTTTTYMRFFPYIKRNYDYGVVIFLLTFNLITVSSYRVSNVLKIAHERFYTIAIGCGICLVMTLFIFPIWSGEDLHNSTVIKLEGLAKSIEACVSAYFNDVEKETTQEKSSEDPIYKGYKAVLDSKSQDETLALHASWEPRHSRHCRYPWQQYVKLGAVLRHFGYTVVALHGCLQSEIQTPQHCRILFKDPMTSTTPSKSQPRLFLGSNKNQATNMLALAAAHANSSQKHEKYNGVSLPSFKTDNSALLEWKSKRMINEHSKPEVAERKVLRPQLSKIAITSLEFSEALPFAAFASLLVETVARLDNIIEEVEELGRIACFKEFKPGDEVIVNIKTQNLDVTLNHFPSQGTE
ncbi:ALUMINUM-ACTIVATED MALATE TRANSPORTER 12-RELATED [Salix viminalis]|uniref:ALUMINUM-ACTIVATED MALATE TRANSPORTER 12-RELATED n=1 Tax=Salix viminalis TaxID=40686 RepID=A0A9Q0TNJ5_SALVM|nr:ALUMINUM-ACTIVATED MALATE TRANSPORTER 12-RELATED [Salix viminalis]